MTSSSMPATAVQHRPLLMRWRKTRTLVLFVRAVKYLMTLGPRQICWLVESLEHAHGHAASRASQMPVDRDGNPLPWYTYPAIQYLSQLDLSDCVAFEFGSGNGSLFWASRVHSLTSVESDRQWYELVSARKLANQRVMLVEDLGEYPTAVFDALRKYDLIIVDGKRRRLCAHAALECLAPNGMIVLDNADWYPKTAALLRDAGLIQIDFSGYGPVNNYTWTTSLFLRPGVKLKPRSERMPEPAIASLVQTGDE
jgi:hypothetical protein